MSGIENWLPDVAAAGSGSALPGVMAAGALAALVVAAAVFLLRGKVGINPKKLASNPAVWGGVVGVFAALLTWTVTEGIADRDRAVARRALDARAAELTLRTLAPGSPLACLDSMSNATVEAACERSLFASPETIAAAVAYVDARVALLADGTALVASDPSYAPQLERMRRAIEADRFGIVAHVFAMRGCTASQCPALKLLHDARQVASNLGERQFDSNVVMYATAWQPGGTAPVGGLQGAPPALMAMPSPSTPPASLPQPPAFAAVPNAATTGTASGVPLSPKYDFPSSASIPAVSIMSAEPPPAEAAPARPASQAASHRRAGAREPAAVPLPVPAPAPPQSAPAAR